MAELCPLKVGVKVDSWPMVQKWDIVALYIAHKNFASSDPVIVSYMYVIKVQTIYYITLHIHRLTVCRLFASEVYILLNQCGCTFY